MIRSRELFPVLDGVEHLAESAEAVSGDPEVLELISSLVSPGLAGIFLSKLGSARDDQERERLIGLSPRLGREVAEALVDALGEARDRRLRRTFLDALGKFGPIGMEMAGRMVEDSRWYVVRNGVSLLGEITGEEAVVHLTATLGNDDPRVRKEAVSALAKVGGDDAAMLLLGMLDDSEAEVRAGACRALGNLRVQRAVKPLLQLLDRDSNIGVQVETLQALGQIGDPGAVPIIEKKAAGGFFFGKPQEIRIAAFRGLAGIGTPHAKGILRKAINDRDPRVRTAVKTLLLSG
jgi:HEAT repeat protein